MYVLNMMQYHIACIACYDCVPPNNGKNSLYWLYEHCSLIHKWMTLMTQFF